MEEANIIKSKETRVKMENKCNINSGFAKYSKKWVKKVLAFQRNLVLLDTWVNLAINKLFTIINVNSRSMTCCSFTKTLKSHHECFHIGFITNLGDKHFLQSFNPSKLICIDERGESELVICTLIKFVIN